MDKEISLEKYIDILIGKDDKLIFLLKYLWLFLNRIGRNKGKTNREVKKEKKWKEV